MSSQGRRKIGRGGRIEGREPKTAPCSPATAQGAPALMAHSITDEAALMMPRALVVKPVKPPASLSPTALSQGSNSNALEEAVLHKEVPEAPEAPTACAANPTARRSPRRFSTPVKGTLRPRALVHTLEQNGTAAAGRCSHSAASSSTAGCQLQSPAGASTASTQLGVSPPPSPGAASSAAASAASRSNSAVSDRAVGHVAGAGSPSAGPRSRPSSAGRRGGRVGGVLRDSLGERPIAAEWSNKETRLAFAASAALCRPRAASLA